MGLFGKFFFGILIYLFLEILVFIKVAEIIGFIPAAGLLFFFSITGYIITKKIKYIAFQNAAFDYSAGKNVSKNLIKSAAYFISGVLFFIPGFISDFFAVLFLIPIINYYIIYLILKYFKNKFRGNFTYYYSNAYNKDESDLHTFTAEAEPFEDFGSDEKPDKTNFIPLPFKNRKNK